MADVVRADVEVLWVSRYDYSPGQAVTVHQHPYAQLMLIFAGTGIATISGETRKVSSGSLLWLPPSVPHGLEIEEPTKTYDVKFDVRNVALAQALADLPCWRQDDTGQCRQLLQGVVQVAETEAIFRRERCALRLHELLLVVLEQHRSHHVQIQVSQPMWQTDDSCLLAFMNVVQERYAEDLSAEEIAMAIGYSYRHVSNRCQRQWGQTPKEIIMAERLRRSQDLLRYSDYPVKSVAGQVGFATVHHFTRCFSKAFGLGPAAWRNKERNRIGEGFVLGQDFANVNRVTNRSDS